MQPAMESLLRRFGDARPEPPSGRGSAALAAVVIDRNGRLVESPAVGISSFAWGVMRALKGDLADLAGWPKVEPDLVRRLEQCLLGTPRDDDEAKRARERPLTKQAIANAFQTLVTELGLLPSWVEAPSFAIRSYCYFKDSHPPDPILLNSFFLTDLALARNLILEGKLPANLQRYLGIQRPTIRRDLLHDERALADAVRPANTPPARWPGKGRHPLVLLQQAAVNLAFEQTSDGGIVGINGPPGTGKTTLLRDIVAGVVTARAEVMCRFDDPETAFSDSGQRLKVGAGWLHLYRLDPSLRGFEMVVASSNNKAVENVSAELPGLGAVAEDAHGLRYLKTLSDELHGTSTWGVIAAVLGNAQNLARFKWRFWRNDDTGLSNYLRAAAGFPVAIDDGQSGVSRSPRIIEVEQPPTSRGEAIGRWNAARQAFQAALSKSRQHQSWLEGLRTELDKRELLHAAVLTARTSRHSADGAVEQNRTGQSHAAADHAAAQLAHEQTQHLIRTHTALRPGFWARLFRTEAARRWSLAMRDLSNQANLVHSELIEVGKRRQTADGVLQIAVQKQESVHAALHAIEADLARCEQRLIEAREQHGVVLADRAFFERPRVALHLSTPWFAPAAQHLRDEVFITAMAVHRAFMDAAAKPLRHNLGAMMNALSSQPLSSPDKQALLPDLWTSLFLVVPLVSTTFASVNRMLGKLPLESLGWLFVDEAGQAVPQAAVGALLRTKRAVIVGDPIQIQPVVTLPDALVQAICRRFGVAPDVYAAPASSVQTLADSASMFATELPTRSGSRSVGVPLLVHRRCSDPMFTVANAIAYAGLMVSAKSSRASRIRDVLGPSMWIDLSGGAEDKWCEEEGKAVLELLGKLKQARVPPNLYIVSPFVIVATRLRQLVESTGLLDDWIEGEGRRWASERVGTVHTAQGREAEAVILVLGATSPSQASARNWAGWPPNLLNVAVTRAQEALYVIGNRQQWRQAGAFAHLDRLMP